MEADTPAKRGDAAFKDSVDEVSRRNEEARRRARGEKEEREVEYAARLRARELNELAALDVLNTGR